MTATCLIGLLFAGIFINFGLVAVTGRLDNRRKVKMYMNMGRPTQQEHERGQRIGGGTVVLAGVALVIRLVLAIN